MSHWTDEEQAQIIAELCRRSSVDSAFRDLALRDPARALAKVTTKACPPDRAFQFVEPSERGKAVDHSGHVTIVVLPDAIPDELSDHELERVAGGGGGDITSTAGYTG